MRIVAGIILSCAAGLAFAADVAESDPAAREVQKTTRDSSDLAVLESLDDALVGGFQSPPDSAKPRVWWHWMNGNVTEDGIKLDLEWMKRVGIGGVTNFDGAFVGMGGDFDTPVIVEKPIVFLSPEWRRALRYSVALADQLGLEFTRASSAGWTLAGGPWVKPQEAMKKLVWSETCVQGGKPFHGRLAQPPETTGYFQNIPAPEIEAMAGRPLPVYYADVATIAYRAPPSERPLASFNPAITTSSGPVDAALLFDGDLAKSVPLPFGKNQNAWIQFSFDKPQRVQAMTVVIDRPTRYPLQMSGPKGWLEASDDGRGFHKLVELPQSRPAENSALEQTFSFAPIAARFFRLVLERPDSSSVQLDAPPVSYRIAELVLHTGARINRFEDKAGFAARQISDEDDTPAIAADNVIHPEDIINLTNQLHADGSLDWTPPAGRWIVLRFGYSLTGKVNEPAPAAGTGLEVDKLHREYVKEYMDTYLAILEKALGADLMGRRGLRYVVTDSYESGPQNWTDDMISQFKKRRGYDPLPWMPVLAGRVVESAEASDRFLWDFRKTLGELLADAFYGQISASLHERGLGRYGESQEYLRFFVGDGMQMKKTADIPMGAMWATLSEELRPNYDADLRESAAAAHIYGRNLVAAESFTAGENAYGFAPQDLKPVADHMMALGVNRFVIHTSVHQPDTKPGPGLGLGPFGQWFTRKETWAEQARPWIEYLTRSSYLLQQGHFVADIAYLYGEDTNLTSLFHSSAPRIPEGFSFDYINTDAMMNELSVQDGRLITRGGMAYRVLAMDASTRRISVPVLRRLRELVRAGATVVGNRPVATPSLGDDEGEFRALVAELWGDGTGIHVVELGRVFAGLPIKDALSAPKVTPDVVFKAPESAALHFVHRSTGQAEIYFVSNGTAQHQLVEVIFRVSGRRPELWRADTGEIAPVSYRMADGQTAVTFDLQANDAVFVVFREPTSEQSAVIPKPTAAAITTVEGPWEISFPNSLGEATQTRFEQLMSWAESPLSAVKYFSGTATYNKVINIKPEWLGQSALVELDLGQVKNLAEIFVNGRPMGVLWKAPFRVDITDALHSGDNRLEIRITNLWPNRLIGDKQPGAKQVAFAAYDPFKADSPLLPSGLLGPVTLTKVIAPIGAHKSDAK